MTKLSCCRTSGESFRQISVSGRLTFDTDEIDVLLRTLTVETQTEMEAVCLRNIEQGLETGKLGFTVPEQKGEF